MSIPLRRQKTLSIVSVISFPSPPFSSIRSQTSLEAFSRTGFLHSHKSVKNALVFTFFFFYKHLLLQVMLNKKITASTG